LKNNTNTTLKILDYIDIFISKLEEFMLAFGVLAMTANTIAAVISRFVFNDAIIVTDEINMIAIVVVTFAGLSYAARHGRHIRMSAIYDAFSAKTRKKLIIIISAITALFMFFLSYFALDYITNVYNSGRILPSLGIQVFYVYLWVPIGFFVTGIQYTLTITKNLQESDVYLSTNVKDGYSDDSNEIEI